MSEANTEGGNAAPSQPSSVSSTRRFMQTVNAGDLQGLMIAQKGITSTIRHLQDDDTVSSGNLKRTVAEMYPPAILFGQKIRDLPGIYTELRDFLDSRGANMNQHSSRRVMMTLATNLYEEQEDTLAATEIVQEVIAAGRRRNTASTNTNVPTPTVTSTSHASPSDLSTERVAHNVTMRLKDNEKKFSGDLGENWMEFVDEYSQVARDYNLNISQKLQYIHNILRGDAKRFYLDRV